MEIKVNKSERKYLLEINIELFSSLALMGIYSWSQQKRLFSHLNYTTKKDSFFLTNKFENILNLASFNNILNIFEKQKRHKKQITIRIY